MTDNAAVRQRHVTLRDGIRVFNKYATNPVMMLFAGRKHWYAAVVHHTGRRSGKSYATPVVAVPTPDGFLIPLPYGTGVDWLRNVLAAGRASVRVHGRSYDVVDPEVVDAATAAPHLTPTRQREFARLRIQNFLAVRPAPTTEPAGPAG